jgi:lysophospholipase L1-like esterase
VLVYGDSLAVGLGPRLKTRAAADRECPSEVVTIAQVGTGVLHWSQRMRADLSHAKAESLIVSLGGNDYAPAAASENLRAKIRAGIAELVRVAREMGVQVFWIHPPPIPVPDAGGVVDMWREEKVPEYPTLAQKDVPYSGDGIHPTPVGYAILADRIWPWVKENSLAR